MTLNYIGKYATLIIAAVLLIVSLFFGWSQGRQKQQASVLGRNVLEIQKGLDYFYKDNDRYPQAAEFQNPAVMLPYFSSFPPSDFVSKNCPSSYYYIRPTLATFELSVCLPTSDKNFIKGWNKITVTAADR